MNYVYSKSAVDGNTERSRRRISNWAALCVFTRLPSRSLYLIGAASGRKAATELCRQTVDFVREPLQFESGKVFQWVMSYGHPVIVKRLIESLATVQSEDWRFAAMKDFDSKLLLPKEHRTPDFQILQTSSGAPKSTIICFAGNNLRPNIPVQLLHCVLAPRFDQLIYLRDPGRRGFLSGLPKLAGNLSEVAQALRDRIPHQTEISVLGTSGGGLAAAVVADQLACRRLALFSPMKLRDRRHTVLRGSLDHVKAANLYFARGNDWDRERAKDWEGVLSRARTIWFDCKSHGTLQHYAAMGGLNSLADWLSGATAHDVEAPDSCSCGNGTHR